MGYFQKGLIELGRLTLNEHGTRTGLGPRRNKKGRKAALEFICVTQLQMQGGRLSYAPGTLPLTTKINNTYSLKSNYKIKKKL